MQKYKIKGYEILEPLGKGTTGEVFKALQKSMNRVVALKILKGELAQNKNFQERFIDEARICAKFSHRHIVQAIDVGKNSKGIFYFVMEYIDGVTVFDMLKEQKVLSEEETREILAQIAKALDYAHNKDFIHHDIKPGNIMVNKLGVAKLCDLGLAKKAGGKVDALTGTPYYISPEQIEADESLDHRSDIYSLGASAYHMATGKVPFGGTPTVVMSKHLTKAIPPPARINPELSTTFCEILTRMLAKKPDQRYASAAELLEDLNSNSSKKPRPKPLLTVAVQRMKRKYRSLRRRRF